MKGIIPYEYYSLTWTTFKNEPYNRLRKTISFVPIDSSNSTNYNAFDNYAKRLFLKKCEDALPKVKTDFNEHMDTGFASLCLPDFETGKKFGLNHKKLILENIVGILDHNILIENKGRGEEKIIKTNLSLDDKQNNDVIAIEEPENNLSHGNLRKLIKSIESKCAGKQLIVTTHSALIVTGLSLENVIWITENDKKMLKDLDKKKTSDYFKKLENDNLLRFILANKVILVEGPTEALLLPRMYSQENTRTLDEEGIDIISCNGLSFEKYLEIGEALNKKVAVLTDNDGDKKKIDRWNAVNSTKEMTKVYMAQDPVDYTWEVCVKKANEELVGKILPVDRDAEYLVNGKSFEDKTLAYMLLHKVDVSLKLIESGQHIAIPNHVKELLEWIKK
jgi:Predicted ATP-dependent endonuclease of the OLD family